MIDYLSDLLFKRFNEWKVFHILEKGWFFSVCACTSFLIVWSNVNASIDWSLQKPLGGILSLTIVVLRGGFIWMFYRRPHFLRWFLLSLIIVSMWIFWKRVIHLECIFHVLTDEEAVMTSVLVVNLSIKWTFGVFDF